MDTVLLSLHKIIKIMIGGGKFYNVPKMSDFFFGGDRHFWLAGEDFFWLGMGNFGFSLGWGDPKF